MVGLVGQAMPGHASSSHFDANGKKFRYRQPFIGMTSLSYSREIERLTQI